MKNLKVLRIQKKLSQEELAKHLAISQSAIHFYENGTKIASCEIAAIIADYFNVTIDYLLGREDNSGITYPQRYIEVSDTERELITKFRKSRREAQKFILHLEDEEEQSNAKKPLDRA